MARTSALQAEGAGSIPVIGFKDTYSKLNKVK